jgi:hypothetical protein
MQVIEIIIPPGLPGDFFCPMSGEPAVDENGSLAISCVAYIPPLAFHDAIIACPEFLSYWEDVLEHADIDLLRDNVTGESINKFLETYESPENQMLIAFRLVTTTIEPRMAPEFSEPIYTLAFFYVVNFQCDLQKDFDHGF